MAGLAALLPLATAGACVGSFCATAALRGAAGESALFGRSRCDACGLSLGYAATIPILSYARRGGVCSGCGGRIDPLHVAGEASGALIALAPWVLGFDDPRAWILTLLGFVLLAASIFDARTQRLPDALTGIVAALCLGLAVFRSAEAFETGLVAAALAFLVLEGLRRGYHLLRRRPGLGFGDVKLAAALSLWLGAATPWAGAAAAATGLAAALILRRTTQERVAFGPFLAFGAFTVGLVNEIARWPTL